MDQALKYSNQAVALDPQNIEAYQRIYEMELAAGHSKEARQALERAAAVKSDDANYWLRLGKLFASTLTKSDETPDPAELERVNEFFTKATTLAGDNAALLKEVADFFAASRQIQRALPLCSGSSKFARTTPARRKNSRPDLCSPISEPRQSRCFSK